MKGKHSGGEAEDVRGLRMGDPDAIRTFYQRYREIVTATICRTGITGYEALDLAESTLSDILVYKLKNFRGGSFIAWVVMIARNAGYEYRRKRMRMAACDVDETDFSREEFRDWYVMARPHNEEVEEPSETERPEVFAKIVSGLRTDDRHVLSVHLQGEKHKEGGERFGVSANTFKQWVYRAKRRFARELQPHSEVFAIPRHYDEGEYVLNLKFVRLLRERRRTLQFLPLPLFRFLQVLTQHESPDERLKRVWKAYGLSKLNSPQEMIGYSRLCRAVGIDMDQATTHLELLFADRAGFPVAAAAKSTAPLHQGLDECRARLASIDWPQDLEAELVKLKTELRKIPAIKR